MDINRILQGVLQLANVDGRVQTIRHMSYTCGLYISADSAYDSVPVSRPITISKAVSLS